MKMFAALLVLIAAILLALVLAFAVAFTVAPLSPGPPPPSPPPHQKTVADDGPDVLPNTGGGFPIPGSGLQINP